MQISERIHSLEEQNLQKFGANSYHFSPLVNATLQNRRGSSTFKFWKVATLYLLMPISRWPESATKLMNCTSNEWTKWLFNACVIKSLTIYQRPIFVLSNFFPHCTHVCFRRFFFRTFLAPFCQNLFRTCERTNWGSSRQEKKTKIKTWNNRGDYTFSIVTTNTNSKDNYNLHVGLCSGDHEI